jgi:hypothetical protein
LSESAVGKADFDAEVGHQLHYRQNHGLTPMWR